MDRRVVVTGLGVVSSVGIGWHAFWEGILQGASGISPVTSFDTSLHFTHNGGEAINFPESACAPSPHNPALMRVTRMALDAASQACADSSAASRESGTRAAVSWGTTLGSLQAIEPVDDSIIANIPPERVHVRQLPVHSTASEIASSFGCRGPLTVFTTACAAGNYAIAQGFDLIRMNRADFVIAGAADAFSRIEFTGFNQFSAVAPDRCQPFDKNRKGMILAEGAAALILEPLDLALRRNARVYGEILGYGLSCDAHHMTTPSVDGVAACMENALRDSGIQKSKVDYISAHGTGTVANDRTEAAAINRVFGELARSLPVSSIKSMIGHSMGAASALEAVACVLATHFDRIPPTINHETPDPECDIDCVPNVSRSQRVGIALNNSYAFGGNNASVVIAKYQDKEDR